jgi:Arc/MetJ-type ribon-helix-helix transcriptional regulator
MGVAKIAVSMNNRLLRRLDALIARKVFRSRSEAIEKALAEKFARLDRSRLARECAKLLLAEEQAMADEGIAKDAAEWPEFSGPTLSGSTLTRHRATSNPVVARSWY